MPELIQLQTVSASGFDTHNPPERALMDACVHCGFCLPACPTYVMWGKEMDSPRGRIYLMSSAAKGQVALDNTFQRHMDNCLGCMACMTACPSGVQYSKLIEDTRGQVERNIPRSLSERLYRRLLFVTFPHHRRLRLLAVPMWVYQRSGMQRLLRSIGVLRLLPRRMRAMEELLPRIPSRLFAKLPSRMSAATPRRRVGMLAGCVQQAFFQHVNEATMRVLAAEGCDVIVPQKQDCCGALMVHSGLDEDARAFARKMIAVFEDANVESVVINAAGCGSTVKDYGHLLRDDSQWAERARAFSAKCKDISEILSEPRSLLNAIPGLEGVEVAEASMCCGSAGVYNLLQPKPAQELGDRKVEHLLATQAQAVVSANPGCLLQLTSGMRRKGVAAMPTFHMVELLDASMRNLSAERLLRDRELQ